MIRMLPRIVAITRRQFPRIVSANQASAALLRWRSSGASSPPEPNALDRSILKLSSVGAEHLPQLLQDMVESEVYYITQNSTETTVQDALTFPSNIHDESSDLCPAFFSSAWAIERYFEQQDLHQELSEAVIHPIGAREFLQQTRPAPVLFNPPVFTLTPDLIDLILQGRYDVVKPETIASKTRTARLDLELERSQCTHPTRLPPPEVIQELTSFMECHSAVVAAYFVQIKGGVAICCLCSMMEVEAFASIEKELHKVLPEMDGGEEYSTLCLNYMPMDTFEFIIDVFTPFYLDLGNMSDVEFDLFIHKLSVGRAPRPRAKERHAVLQRLRREDLPVQAAYQLVYKICGYPTTGRIGTFLDAGEDAPPPQRSVRECLHRGWGFLHELPPELAHFCRSKLEPFYIATSDK